jgi:hypothetical protein
MDRDENNVFRSSGKLKVCKKIKRKKYNQSKCLKK